jgi:hypothetical protein
VTITPSTISVTGPKAMLGPYTASNSGHPLSDKIVPPSFTIEVSNPTAITRVDLELTPWVSPIVWYNNGVWPPAGVDAHADIPAPGGMWVPEGQEVDLAGMPETSARMRNTIATSGFGHAGMWSARTIVTFADGTVRESGHHAFEVFNPVITVTADPVSPTVGTATSISANMAPGAPAGFGNTVEGWHAYRDGDTWRYQGGFKNNPWAWTPGDTVGHYFCWVETFPDGSRIHSNNCRVTPQAVVVPPPVITHFHETVSSGGRHEIQSAMDRAHNWFMANKNARVNFDDENSMACVILASGVTFTLDAALHYRRGVRLVAEGATVITGEAVTTHLIRPDNNGGGGYNNPHYDWQIIGGTWHGNDRAGGFSVVHTSRFRLTV